MRALLALLAASAAADEPSLLRSRPEAALVNEIVELRPAAGHHFSPEAPQRCGKARAGEVTPRRFRCRFEAPGEHELTASICDDAKTFCRQERLQVKVSGPAAGAMAASPVKGAPKGGHRAPEGFIDNDPAAAVARARREGKLILTHFYGIWCPPCNQLEEEAYPRPEFAEAAKDFVLLGLDADAEASFDWKARFAVGGYPTVLVADADLREIDRFVGFRPAPSLAAFLARAKADRASPVEKARGLRAARWRLERGEHDRAEALLKGDASPEARKLALEVRAERARLRDDSAARLSALSELAASFPEDPSFALWAQELAGAEPARAASLREPVLRSVARWSADPALYETGLTPVDLRWYAAEVEHAISSSAAVPLWSALADELEAEARRSPLEVPRAANFSRGQALLKAGRKEEARGLYERLVAAYPNEFTFNYNYGYALAEAGENEKALKYAAAAVDAGYGDNWLRAVGLKARVERSLGRVSDAARTLDEALAQAVVPRAEVRTARYLLRLRALRAELAAPKKS